MVPNKKVAYYTLGCKLNFSETSTIARNLTDAGYARVPFDSQPDVVVINTCSVTENADKKCGEIVRKSLRINPNSFIVVIGCYAQLKPEEISNIRGVDIVLGANEKFDVSNYLDDLGKKDKGEHYSSEILKTREFFPSYSQGDRTRTFLKIQDGCNYFCAFCTIPLARGRSRNASIANTLSEANKVTAQEIVLTGVNIGDFGQQKGESFFELIQELDQLDNIKRYRISSIEPNLLSNEIIDFISTSNSFLPHFHIPLQSGSDIILQAMRRRYLTALYKQRVTRIKTIMPDACIGVDVIVGFPGETDEIFEETYNFIKDLPVSYLHVFSYSERDNTTALRIDEVVSKQKRQERSKMLRILSNKKKRAFYQEHSGKVFEVLFESENDDGFMYGFTENYIRVKTEYNKKLENQIIKVHLKELLHDGVYLISIKEKNMV